MNQTHNPNFIGRFPITDTLGIGGMGVVYLATDPDIGRKVAIKVLQTSDDDSALERFKNEARTMGEISHPNIVMLLEYGIQQNKPFLVMEYLSGISLQKWIQTPHKLIEHKNIITDICNAIEFAHNKGILHRDLKPGNIQVLPDGQAKLLDFGIATSRNSGLTATGFFIGTPKYLAPEILQTTIHTKSSDCYSLGLLAYTMLSGRNPFAADTFETTMSRQLTVKPALLSDLNSKIPIKLAKIIDKYLDKNPDSRPNTPELLKQALQQLPESVLNRTIVPDSNSHQSKAHETTFVISQNPTRHKQHILTPILILVLIISAGVIAYEYLYKGPSDPSTVPQILTTGQDIKDMDSTTNQQTTDDNVLQKTVAQNGIDETQTSQENSKKTDSTTQDGKIAVINKTTNNEPEKKNIHTNTTANTEITKQPITSKIKTSENFKSTKTSENIISISDNNNQSVNNPDMKTSDTTNPNNSYILENNNEPQIPEQNPVAINLPELNHRTPKVRLNALTGTQLSRGKTSTLKLELSDQTEIDSFEIYRGVERTEQIKIKEVEKISGNQVIIRFYVDPNTTLGSYTLKGKYGMHKTYPLYIEVTL